MCVPWRSGGMKKYTGYPRTLEFHIEIKMKGQQSKEMDKVAYPLSEKSAFDTFVANVLSDITNLLGQPHVNTQANFAYYL